MDNGMRNNAQAALAKTVKEKEEGGDSDGALEVLGQCGEAAGAAFAKKLRSAAYANWAATLVKAEDWREAVRVLKAACEEFPRDRNFRTSLKPCEGRLAGSD